MNNIDAKELRKTEENIFNRTIKNNKWKKEHRQIDTFSWEYLYFDENKKLMAIEYWDSAGLGFPVVYSLHKDYIEDI